MTTRRPLHTQAGFTLVELMVVVAILGVLAATAFIYTGNYDPTAAAARETHSMLAMARKLAINHGPPQITGQDGVSAKLRVEEDGTTSTLSVWELIENVPANTGTWTEVATLRLDKNVQVFSLTSSTNLDGGVTPTAVSGTTDVLFKADGSAPGILTLYLKHRTKTNGDKYRIYMFPLAGQATVARGW